MSLNPEKKLLKETILQTSKDIKKNYSRILKKLPQLLKDYYKHNNGYRFVFDYVNEIFEELFEFSQVQDLENFYNKAYDQQINLNSLKYKFNYNFSLKDTEFKKQFNNINSFLTSKYQNATEKAKTIKEIKALWNSGEDLEKAIESLEKIFEKSEKRALKYAQTVIITNNTKIRTKADLNTYSKNKVEYYKYDALIDDVTTDTCKELDGKKFKVSEALNYQTKIDDKLKDILENKKLEEWQKYNKVIKYLYKNDAFATKNKEGLWESSIILRTKNPEVQGKRFKQTFKHLKDIAGNKLPRPPLHYNCRSSLRPIL